MELPVPSIGGKNYLLTLIDDYSRYAKVEFLRNKSDTTKALKQMITEAKLETGHKLKTICCDKGGEYISEVFLSYLHKRGIKMQETHVDAPYENGVAE